MKEPLPYEEWPTADEIRAHRNETGDGLEETKRKLIGYWFAEVLMTLKLNVELGCITAEEAVVQYIDFTLKKLESEKAPWDR